MKKIDFNNYKVRIKNKTKKTKTKFKDLCNKIRNFVVKESNYMIFLIMLLTISIMFESYGFTKTIPFVIIIPFLLGTFYKGRKRIMMHTVIAMIVLASVSQDVENSARVILVGTIAVFSGLFVSKYIDHFKRYNWFRKIFSGIIAFTLLIFALVVYSFQYGNPDGYLKTQNNVMKLIDEETQENLSSMGITYNYDLKSYDIEFLLKEDYTTKVVYHYYPSLDRIYTDDEIKEILNKSNEENENLIEENFNDEINN